MNEHDDELELYARKTNGNGSTTALVQELVEKNRSPRAICKSLMISSEVLRYHLKKLGISPAEYRARFEKQRERCPHCGRPMD